MTTFVLTLIGVCLIVPVATGKLLRNLDERRFEKRLQGLTDRYSHPEQTDKRSFHVKRLR